MWGGENIKTQVVLIVRKSFVHSLCLVYEAVGAADISNGHDVRIGFVILVTALFVVFSVFYSRKYLPTSTSASRK